MDNIDWQKRWAYQHGGPVATAYLRETPQNFQVIEIADHRFSGDGEHDWLWVEKTGSNTDWVAAQLGRFAGVKRSDVAYSGRKDRHAVCRQWFSVRLAGKVVDWTQLTDPEFSILDVKKHRAKLRKGQHIGNRFVLRLTNLSADADQLELRLQSIKSQGVPNYVGEQRFGRWFAPSLAFNERPQSAPKDLWFSAWRSYLFNVWLEHYVDQGSTRFPFFRDDGGQVLPSHLLKDGVTTSPVLPLCGGVNRRDDQVAEHIHPPEAIEGTYAQLSQYFKRQRVDMAFRDAILKPAAMSWVWEDQSTLVVSFELVSGSFATTVIREAFDYSEPAFFLGE